MIAASLELLAMTILLQKYYSKKQDTILFFCYLFKNQSFFFIRGGNYLLTYLKFGSIFGVLVLNLLIRIIFIMTQENLKKFNSRDVVTLVLIVGVLCLGVLSILRDRIVNVDQERFVVSAEGKIFAKPDIANISFGVKTDTQKEAKDAVVAGTEKMNKVISVLKDLGIEEDYIKTTAYNLRSVYEYPKDEGKRVLSGYELDQTITLKIKDLDKIGEVIREATNAGANQSGGINFTIDDTEELKAQARAEAIKRAKKKAGEISDESGIKIGKLVNVSEYGGDVPVFRNSYAYADEAAGMMKSMDAIPDIESGEMEITVNVSLTYKVK